MNMSKTKLDKRFRQGYYIPKNPTKYIGDFRKLIFKSSLERKFMTYCDLSDIVTKWGYEMHAIPYYFPVDRKTHQYKIDFWIELKEEQGKQNKYLIEIKPENGLKKPTINENKKTFKSVNNFNKAASEYIKNMSKWKYAEAFAKKMGVKFKVITDKDLQQIK